MKEIIVASGTIVRECGPNYLVLVDASYEPNTSLPIPIFDDITTVGEVIGNEVLWPDHLIILSSATFLYIYI